MKKHNLSRWIFQIPLDDIRSHTYAERGAKNPCICCGKDIKKPRYWVHLLTNGNLVSTEEPFSDGEDQGMFLIGNTCKDKLPNNFYFKFTD